MIISHNTQLICQLVIQINGTKIHTILPPDEADHIFLDDGESQEFCLGEHAFRVSSFPSYLVRAGTDWVEGGMGGIVILSNNIRSELGNFRNLEGRNPDLIYLSWSMILGYLLK